MTTDNNTNPVVKESLTTQKEEMQRGMKILDVGTVIKPGDTFKYVTVEYMALVQNSCDIQLQMCAATRIALDKLADLYIALQSENDQLKKVIDQCEEALKFMIDVIDTNLEMKDDSHYTYYKKALSTIQSLKLKGK